MHKVKRQQYRDEAEKVLVNAAIVSVLTRRRQIDPTDLTKSAIDLKMDEWDASHPKKVDSVPPPAESESIVSNKTCSQIGALRLAPLPQTIQRKYFLQSQPLPKLPLDDDDVKAPQSGGRRWNLLDIHSHISTHAWSWIHQLPPW